MCFGFFTVFGYKMPKRPKKTVLNGECREFVIRLQDYFERECQNGRPLLPVTQVGKRVADALCIGRATVSRITQEKYGDASTGVIGEDGEKKLSTPNKKRRRISRITAVDDFDAAEIRNHVYAYYRRGEYPTLRKLIVSLKDFDLFKGSLQSLATMLQKIGFTYKKSEKRKIIMERTDIAVARVEFLRKAKSITDWDKVLFLDETSLYVNHTVPKDWTDNTIQSVTKLPEGKGQCLIIVHAGTANGFIHNCSMAFESMKTNEHHEEMNFERFKEWFINLLQNLHEPHIIIMDNAPYHSMQKDKAPTSSSKKLEIISWLQSKGIEANENMLKHELVRLVKLNKPKKLTYILDEIAEQNGHTVFRLPQYHSHYNAVARIWAYVKGHVAQHNTSPPFTAEKILTLLQNAYGNVTADDWRNIVEHTKKIILEEWERDVHFDRVCEQELSINLMDSSSSCESSDDNIDIHSHSE